MLKNASRKSASIFPPGIMDRAQYQKMRDEEIAGLKAEIKSNLAEADELEKCSFFATITALEHNACVAMRRLIEMGAL